MAKLGEIIDGELSGHGVSEQQAIVVGQGQSTGSLGGFCIQLEVACGVIGLQASGFELRDPEPLPLGIEDDTVGSMAGGDRLFQIEIIIQQQQAITAVIGDQQGAVIGAGNLAQIAPSGTSFRRLPLSRSSRVTEPALRLAVTRRGLCPSS